MQLRITGWIAAATFVGIALGASEAEAATTLRCPDGIVNRGDNVYDVRSACGDPDFVEEYIEYRTVRERVGNDCHRKADGDRVCTEIIRERTVEIPMLRLTYDFGKNRFVQYLTFERGTLVGIARGSYGQKPRVAG